MKLNMIIMLFVLTSVAWAQEKPETSVDAPAHNIGGKTEFDYIFQAQLVYPEDLLKAKVSEDVTVYFVVAADGSVHDVMFKQSYNKALEQEARRLLRFYLFEPAMKDGGKVISQSWLTFRFNAEAYKKICKARGFSTPVYVRDPDTSFVIYHRADVSPEYYKGEEALNEFILKELDYPPIAVKQNIQGTVVLNFVVEPNGCPGNIAVLRGVNAGCSEEAIRVLRLTRWKPAVKDGHLVRYNVTYPIVFNLNNINKDNSSSEQR